VTRMSKWTLRELLRCYYNFVRTPWSISARHDGVRLGRTTVNLGRGSRNVAHRAYSPARTGFGRIQCVNAPNDTLAQANGSHPKRLGRGRLAGLAIQLWRDSAGICSANACLPDLLGTFTLRRMKPDFDVKNVTGKPSAYPEGHSVSVCSANFLQSVAFRVLAGIVAVVYLVPSSRADPLFQPGGGDAFIQVGTSVQCSNDSDSCSDWIKAPADPPYVPLFNESSPCDISVVNASANGYASQKSVITSDGFSTISLVTGRATANTNADPNAESSGSGNSAYSVDFRASRRCGYRLTGVYEAEVSEGAHIYSSAGGHFDFTIGYQTITSHWDYVGPSYAQMATNIEFVFQGVLEPSDSCVFGIQTIADPRGTWNGGAGDSARASCDIELELFPLEPFLIGEATIAQGFSYSPLNVVSQEHNFFGPNKNTDLEAEMGGGGAWGQTNAATESGLREEGTAFDYQFGGISLVPGRALDLHVVAASTVRITSQSPGATVSAWTKGNLHAYGYDVFTFDTSETTIDLQPFLLLEAFASEGLAVPLEESGIWVDLVFTSLDPPRTWRLSTAVIADPGLETQPISMGPVFEVPPVWEVMLDLNVRWQTSCQLAYSEDYFIEDGWWGTWQASSVFADNSVSPGLNVLTPGVTYTSGTGVEYLDQPLVDYPSVDAVGLHADAGALSLFEYLVLNQSTQANLTGVLLTAGTNDNQCVMRVEGGQTPDYDWAATIEGDHASALAATGSVIRPGEVGRFSLVSAVKDVGWITLVPQTDDGSNHPPLSVVGPRRPLELHWSPTGTASRLTLQNCMPGMPHTVETCADLRGTNWTFWTNFVAGTYQGQVATPATGSVHFYRAHYDHEAP